MDILGRRAGPLPAVSSATKSRVCTPADRIRSARPIGEGGGLDLTISIARALAARTLRVMTALRSTLLFIAPPFVDRWLLERRMEFVRG
jgi:hypothetical protein